MIVVAHSGCVPFSLGDALCQVIEPLEVAVVKAQPGLCIPNCNLPFLRQGKEMDNPLQKRLMTVLKRILMVKDTTPSWCVMRKCGLEPLQFNWFRAAVRLYNA